MPDPALDAETSRLLAVLRGNLADVPDGALIPRAIASPMRSQFPGTPGLGRILVAAAQAVRGLMETGAEHGAELGADQLLLALAFAGAVIDQDEEAPVADGLKKGDIAHVVLDCVPVERGDGPHRRVIVRGVYPAGSELPAPYENGTRNVVDVFIGLDMQVPAFLIAYPREVGKGKRGA